MGDKTCVTTEDWCTWLVTLWSQLWIAYCIPQSAMEVQLSLTSAAVASHVFRNEMNWKHDLGVFTLILWYFELRAAPRRLPNLHQCNPATSVTKLLLSRIYHVKHPRPTYTVISVRMTHISPYSCNIVCVRALAVAISCCVHVNHACRIVRV